MASTGSSGSLGAATTPPAADSRMTAAPSVVEMEVGSRCNRACPYCPVFLNPRPAVPARMSDEVFHATVDQLAEVSFAGRLSYHLYNEPLLRRDLPRLVATVRRRLPQALQILNTNGDLLDDAKHAQLRAAGIDVFYVTRHSPGPYPDRPAQVMQTWQDLTLTNRGGTLTELPVATAHTRRTPCHAPAEMLVVTVTGDVLLCYEDADRQHVMGNLLDTPLPVLWNSPRFRAMRARLTAGDRSVDPMCQSCTNVSHAEPGRSAVEDTVLHAFGLTDRDGAVEILKQRSETARRDAR